jgi:glutathione synthase/RimK-type ligase-like ATP-grasp enzyme
MARKNYVWYSPATDKTGRVLMEQLGCEGGTKKPVGDYDIICWGTKIKKDETFKAGIKVFNNPNNIRKNRNKLTALEIMKNAKCNVAEFSSDPKTVGKKGLQFPIVGRTKFHQGGQGFWLCLTKSQIENSLKEGAEYFQAFLDIKTEYRLHVVGGEVIYAVKKVARNQDDLKDAYEGDWKDQINNYADKKEEKLDEKTLDFALKRLSRKNATGVDMVVRSNTRGWKFSRVALDKVNKDLAAEAIKAVKALGLDYGAVDCCIDQDGKVWIIECNTGPGLEGSPLEAWVKALKELISEKKKAEPVKKAAVEKAAGKVVEGNLREQLKGSASMMDSMIENASDDELAALSNIWEKMGIKK